MYLYVQLHFCRVPYRVNDARAIAILCTRERGHGRTLEPEMTRRNERNAVLWRLEGGLGTEVHMHEIGVELNSASAFITL